MKIVKCPDCFGDGKETCHNPDHGFLSAMSSVIGANESACPCCGHSEDHKVIEYIGGGKYEYPKCETCKGVGLVSIDLYNQYVDTNVSKDDRDYVDSICLEQ